MLSQNDENQSLEFRKFSSFLFHDGMVGSGFFQFGEGGEGVGASIEVFGKKTDAVAMGVEASRMDGESLLGGTDCLGVALEVLEEKEAFPSAGTVLPRGPGDGFAMETQTFVDFPGVGRRDALLVVEVGKKDVLGQPKSAWDEEESDDADGEGDLGTESDRERLALGGGLPGKSEKKAEDGPTRDDGGGHAGGKLEEHGDEKD